MIVLRLVAASLFLMFMFLAGATVSWFALFGDLPW